MTTFREKLKKEHPEYVGDVWCGGCKDCPGTYYDGGKTIYSCNQKNRNCTACWDREIPEKGDKTMRFKVGDRVRVRTDLIADKVYGGETFVESMNTYKGNTYKIEDVSGCYYYLKGIDLWNFTDEMLDWEKFTKADLRTGYIVTLRNSKRYRVLIDASFVLTECDVLLPIDNDIENGIALSNYNNDLMVFKYNHIKGNDRDFDIIKVEKCDSYSNKNDGIVLWERRDEIESKPKKITVNEIEKLLGYPVEIVSEA